jgi:hypothetical protein
MAAHAAATAARRKSYMDGWKDAYGDAWCAGFEAASEYATGHFEDEREALREDAIECGRTLAEDDVYMEGYADALRDNQSVVKDLRDRVAALEREAKS